MSRPGQLSDPHQVKDFAKRLSTATKLKSNGDREREPEVLAQSFSELEESFRAFLETHLPKLTDPKTSPEELDDLLIEVGEEFRHILYHLREPQFYRYLFTD
jgi:hypothetical protein